MSKFFFSFIRLLIMCTEQFFKYIFNCVFESLSGVNNRAFEKAAGVVSAHRLI